jgi:hypothetical protein
MLKLYSDGGNSSHKKCKGSYCGACGGLWRSLRLTGVRDQVIDFVLVRLVVAVKILSHLMHFIKTFHKLRTINSIYKDNAAINRISWRFCYYREYLTAFSFATNCSVWFFEVGLEHAVCLHLRTNCKQKRGMWLWKSSVISHEVWKYWLPGCIPELLERQWAIVWTDPLCLHRVLNSSLN